MSARASKAGRGQEGRAGGRKRGSGGKRMEKELGARQGAGKGEGRDGNQDLEMQHS